MPQKTGPKGVREIAELPDTARGDARAGLEYVQEYLNRFGYLDRDLAKSAAARRVWSRSPIHRLIVRTSPPFTLLI